MSKQIGFNYSSNKISKHSDSYFRERTEEFDYINNEMRYTERYSERKNKQTGSDWTTGIGFFPKTKPALQEGNTCTTVATRADNNQSIILGIKCGNRDVTPKEGGSDSGEDGEVSECPPDPKRPGLKYKRTRRRRTEYKDGDHVSQTSFGIGINW